MSYLCPIAKLWLNFWFSRIFLLNRNVAMGYYLNEEKTREEFYEEDGFRWFKTGMKIVS